VAKKRDVTGAGYALSEQPAASRPSNGAEGYGVALATRAPLGPLRGVRFEPYGATAMQRGVLLGRAACAGVGEVVLGSTHLEVS
jgi:hypothetical protein